MTTSRSQLLQHRNKTTGESNLTKRPHCRHILTMWSYSLGGANAHPYLIHASLDTGHTRVDRPHGTSIGLAAFAQLTAYSSYTLQWSALRPQNCPSAGYLDPQVVPCQSRVHNPNGIATASAVFAGLTIVTDRQTDHASVSVTVGCICVVLWCGLTTTIIRYDGLLPKIMDKCSLNSGKWQPLHNKKSFTTGRWYGTSYERKHQS